MMTYMADFKDIAIAVIPATITATAALFTLIINTILTIKQNALKYNQEQFAIIQKLYPILRTQLQKSVIALSICRKNKKLYKEKDIYYSLINYFTICSDEVAYRKSHENCADEIDTFTKSIKTYVKGIIELNETIQNSIFPSAPLMHPLLKRSINKMIANIMRWSNCFTYDSLGTIDIELIKNMLKGYNLSYKKIQLYIKKLDSWYKAY